MTICILTDIYFPLRYISEKILGKWVCPISGEVCVFAFGLDHGRFKHFVELVSMMLQYVDTKFEPWYGQMMSDLSSKYFVA